MTGNLLHTKPLVNEIKENLKNEVKKLMREEKTPHLAVILVGNHPASEVYVQKKKEACEEIGVIFSLHRFDDDISQSELISEISTLGGDPHITGILIQLPLPKNINADKVISCIPPKKDVDGLGLVNTGKLHLGYLDGMTPATPLGIMTLLHWHDVDLIGAEVVVIGRSFLVGHPLASLLSAAGATITVCHKQTKNLAKHTKEADILIVATGVPHLIRGDMVKKGALIIDVGITRTESGIIGDVNTEECLDQDCTVTPVPGGVGPMTVVSLLGNIVRAAQQ